VIDVVPAVALAAAEDAALAPALAALDVLELTGLALDPQAARALTASPAALKLVMTVNRRNVTSVVATSHCTTTQSDQSHAPVISGGWL
jgi:hypothetical protein